MKDTAALFCAGLFVTAVQWFMGIMYGGHEGWFLMAFLAAWGLVHWVTLMRLQHYIELEERQRRIKELAISENRKSNLGGE